MRRQTVIGKRTNEFSKQTNKRTLWKGKLQKLFARTNFTLERLTGEAKSNAKQTDKSNAESKLNELIKLESNWNNSPICKSTSRRKSND